MEWSDIMTWDWTTFWIVILIGFLVLAWISVFIWFLNLRSKKIKEPSHIDLYFQDNFRSIMDEWDMVTRPKLKSYKKDLNQRLSKCGEDIDKFFSKRVEMEKRMTRLDRELTKLEGL
jgi:hypothetical protein